MAQDIEKTPKPSLMTRFLNTVEWLGNLLPKPVNLFVIFCIIILVTSAITSYFDLSVVDPRPEGTKGRSADGMIRVVNLLNGDGLRLIVENTVKNFTGFVPLGTVLVALLGVGIAESSGLISAALRGIVLNSPKKLITAVVVFAGVISNTASELGYVVLIPLGAMIFYSVGRHPLSGLAAAFAGVSGGYSANLLLGTVDPLLSGITQEAARLIAPDYTVGPEANWYFMFVSTFLITGLGTFVTEKIIEPKLGNYNPNDAKAGIDSIKPSFEALTAEERKGLKYAGISVLIFLTILALLVIPSNAPLRNQSTGAIAGSPFLRGIVVFIFIFFAIPGYVYGRVTGSMKSSNDAVEAMSRAISNLGEYIVLVFFAAQFVAYFKWSNLGSVLAVLGANFLNDTGLNGSVLLIVFILICALINLMIGSASAQWAVTAPIFVPMLMLTGYAPEMIQAAYRIGDSVTNIITPMMSYFALIMAMVNKYKRDAGIGTIVAMMLPYSVIFLIGWSLLFYLWVFVLNLPVGPNSATYFTV